MATKLQKKLAEAKKQKQIPHLIIEARAGTGKTTTLVEGLKSLRGQPTKIQPSEQQKAIWDALKLSPKGSSACFVAFNKSIAEELHSRVPGDVDAMTMHSMGLKAITAAIGRVQVNQYRVRDIIEEITGRDIRELQRTKPTVIKAVESLVGLAKQSLTDTSSQEDLYRLSAHYDIDLNGSEGEIFDLVHRVIQRCADVRKDMSIDFNDMIWIPVILNLPLTRYSILLVDEAQDLNRCQQELARKVGDRLILCGDPKQAIYGFAGADSQSMSRMQETLGETDSGVTVLPLNVTRRCGKKIVAEAKKIVPDFEAHETNGEGLVSEEKYETYHDKVSDGDMVLCRTNAPLVGNCFRFLRMGRKASIQGRDIGAGLISTIKKMKAYDIADFRDKIHVWLNEEVRKENTKKNPSEAKIISLQDRYECLCTFADESKTIEEMISAIEGIFSDTTTQGIRFSSIHRAKGLESENVWFLMPKGGECPHPMAKSDWQKGQEMNLLYVGITRAIKSLIFVYQTHS